ncbi:alkylhydroperoxidase AhpD family core domain-containing protein [Streptomyces zhaozhouensis]|uniref:Alkylhydroperoxidase AhpD family core domain-containing protein n=1 Tax=Streptomyces zhaozhouensis TaxID=1300267 RepID=A0A286DTQ3_9ACTN|nr:carboxymuconolactone decarboxylase family protein [Streptomyces zhaozhouensis]SOD62021.1 alkylhydroperoxidase AhpD family core domain-containing protein [Streptomyces zhaozhouensis]
MKARINVQESKLAGKVVRQLVGAAQAVNESGLSPVTQELVKIRVSQINGCGFCVDMHTKEAGAAGETDARMHMIAVWREATVFSDAERAALALAEEGTRIADAAGGVPDAVWEEAARHFTEDELTALTSLIAVMSAFNRLNVIIQQPAGDYQPGQFG